MAENSGNVVAELLRQLAAKEITTEQMAKSLSSVKWPKMPPKAKNIFEVDAARDSIPDPANGFTQIAQAYTDGEITLAQYTVFAEAAAAGK